MFAYLKTWAKLEGDRRGVTMMEYGLMAALIAVVCIGAVTTLGGDLTGLFNAIGGKLNATAAG